MYGSNAANASYMDVQSNGNVNGDEQRTPPDEPIIPVVCIYLVRCGEGAFG